MAWEIRKSGCIQQQRDRISLLPDEILCQIMSSSIPTKDVVKTCTLSKRWKSLWTFVHAVQLKDHVLFSSSKTVSDAEKARFMNFCDGVLNQVTFLRRLDLRCSRDYDISRVKRLIDLVISKLQNQNNNNVALEALDLKFSARQIVKLPPSVFISKKLVILKLSSRVELKFPSVVWLPSLKVLHLRAWYFPRKTMKCIDVSSVENILAGCPNLEELLLEVVGCMRDKLKKRRLCVKSSSLKRLSLDLDCAILRIEIDASNLEEVVLKFDMPKRSVFLITSVPLLTRVRLVQCNFQLRPADKDYCGNTLIELLRKVSNTEYFFLSSNAMMCLEHGEFYQQVPIFKNLLHLELQAFSSSLPILPCLLKNWPNLVSFTLKVMIITIRPPLKINLHCLKMTMTMLKNVVLSYKEECDHEMELVTYFLKNAPVLKKMSVVIYFNSRMEKKEASLLYNRLLHIPKASIACEVVAKIYDSNFNIIFPCPITH